MEVARRVPDGFPDERPCGAVEDRVDPGALQEPAELVGVAVAADLERGHAGHGLPVAGRQVVEDNDLVARLEEPLDRDRADVSGSAGYENAHGELPPEAIDGPIIDDDGGIG